MTHEYSHDNIEGMYEIVDIYMRDSILPDTLRQKYIHTNCKEIYENTYMGIILGVYMGFIWDFFNLPDPIETT